MLSTHTPTDAPGTQSKAMFLHDAYSTHYITMMVFCAVHTCSKPHQTCITHTHTLLHTRLHAHIHTHKHTNTHAHTHTHTNVHTQTHIYTHTYTHNTHTHTHAQKHTNTHTCTHTYTYTRNTHNTHRWCTACLTLPVLVGWTRSVDSGTACACDSVPMHEEHAGTAYSSFLFAFNW